MGNLEVKNVNEVYFASTVEYHITYKGTDYHLRKSKDSNGGEAYIYTKNGWEYLYDDSHGEIANELNHLLWVGALD